MDISVIRTFDFERRHDYKLETEGRVVATRFDQTYKRLWQKGHNHD